MLPFTYEMFDAYQRYKANEQIIADRRFEYSFAVGQLTDESTDGDYEEVNFLKGVLQDTMNANFTEYEQRLIDVYIHNVVRNDTKDRKTSEMKKKKSVRFANEDTNNLRVRLEQMMNQTFTVDERKRMGDMLADYQKML